MTGTDLAVRAGQAPTAVSTISDKELNTLFRVAKALAASGMFRDSRQAEQAFARILCGRDLGLSPTEAMTSIHIIEGKPELSADLQAAMLRTYVGPEGERYDYRVVTPQDKRTEECHIEVSRRRDTSSDWQVLGVEVYTLNDANTAGLTAKKNWKLFRRNMLFARAMSNAIAFHAPETAHSPRTVASALAAATETSSEGAALYAAQPDGDVSDGSGIPRPSGTSDEDVIDATATEDPAGEDIERDVAAERQARIDARSDRSSSAQYQHLVRVFQGLKDDAPFLEALDIVAAPEHEEIAQRVARMTEGQADEVLEMFRPEPLH